MSVRATLDQALVSGWFGAGLPADARLRLTAIAEVRSFEPGTVVIREGELVDSLGIVVDGRMAIRLGVPGRASVTILTIEPGDCVGWSALVPPHRATSTIVAVEPTTVVAFDGTSLRAVMDEDPATESAILRSVLEAVARRLVATRTQLLDLFARAGDEPW